MADTKVSALSALTGANVAQLSDVIPIVDTSVTTTKKILVSELANAMFVLGTEQASTSGTYIDFTSIPSWVKRDRKSTRLNSSHIQKSRMPSSA